VKINANLRYFGFSGHAIEKSPNVLMHAIDQQIRYAPGSPVARAANYLAMRVDRNGGETFAAALIGPIHVIATSLET
jgi:hypothetical protein